MRDLFLLVIGGFLFFCISFAARAEIAAFDESSAVIFQYHRIGEDQYPDSNLRLEQFKEHIQELQGNGYNVMPVSAIISALKKNKKLPDKTIGITLEGAYHSTLENAVPLLLDAGLPFTIFVATDRIDRQSGDYMTWDELRGLLKDNLVDIGALPAAYIHMIDYEEVDLRSYLNRTTARFREELGDVPELFAYPFGDRNQKILKLVQTYNFKAAFGQHSGVLHKESNFFDLPRFSMTESYGDLDRFELAATALPLPVEDVVPGDPEIENNPPSIGFTLNESLENTRALACFASGLGRVDFERIERRVEIRLTEPFTEDRGRLNCTMPIPEKKPGERQRWRWFGMLFSVPAP